MTQLQVMFTLTDKPIFSLNPKELKEHQLNKELFGDLPDNEYDKLKKDIAERGIQDPLHVVKQKDKWLVVSGHQRKKIAEELKINVPCINRTDLKKDWQIEEQLIADNLFRRHLKDWQLTPIFEKRLEIEKTKAKQRQKEHGETAPGKPKNTGGKISTSDKGKSRDKAAEGLGRSGRQLEKISKVYHEAPEDIKKQWKNDEITTHTAYKKLKREKVIEEQKAKLKIKPMPTGKYGVIYADCPWKYEFTKTKNREIENKYPTMTLSELKNMILPEVEEDAVLYLWATAPKLLEALEVMKTWGFKYKTHAIWDKQKIGMGYWFRGQHELLLVGTKGNINPPLANNRVSSVFSYPRKKHSEKPREIRELIHKWYPNLNKIELFARGKKDNWEVWGNE